MNLVKDKILYPLLIKITCTINVLNVVFKSYYNLTNPIIFFGSNKLSREETNGTM